jgi:RNA polymerase sigma factor (sigma-70 family)
MKKPENLQDEDVIDGIVRGGQHLERSLGYLYRQYYDLLEHYVESNSGDKDDAADVIQDSFLVFVKMVEDGRFRGESSIKSILYAICRNLWITELRKRKTTMARHERYEAEKDNMTMDVSSEISRQEDSRLVMELFETMGEKCKNVLLAFYYENLSMKEISLREGFSNEQVLRNKKHKCLKALIEKIQNHPTLSQTLKNALQNGQ